MGGKWGVFFGGYDYIFINLKLHKSAMSVFDNFLYNNFFVLIH